MPPRPFAARFIPFVAALATLAALEACATPPSAEPPAAPTTVVSPPPIRAATAPGTSGPVTKTDVAPVLAGTVIHVVDGDTLDVRLSSGPIAVRLASIDAPEHDQPGGAEATSALRRRLEGRQVELQVETQDQYQRLVAFVYLGGEDINSWMVQQGHAWAYRQYADDPRYCVWEADARTYRRGLWQAAPGSQKAPWEWRRAQREDGAFRFTDYQRETVPGCVRSLRKSVDSLADNDAPRRSQPAASAAVVPAPAAGECRIKGNISASGRIYHVPGSDAYDDTWIDTRKGERWFCTEAEARAAGWRAPR